MDLRKVTLVLYSQPHDVGDGHKPRYFLASLLTHQPGKNVTVEKLAKLGLSKSLNLACPAAATAT